MNTRSPPLNERNYRTGPKLPREGSELGNAEGIYPLPGLALSRYGVVQEVGNAGAALPRSTWPRRLPSSSATPSPPTMKPQAAPPSSYGDYSHHSSSRRRAVAALSDLGGHLVRVEDSGTAANRRQLRGLGWRKKGGRGVGALGIGLSRASAARSACEQLQTSPPGRQLHAT